MHSKFLDESGSDSEEDNPNSDYTSLSDFVSEMRISEICGEIRGKIKYSNKLFYLNEKKIFSGKNLS
jgi:hypothetical protein